VGLDLQSEGVDVCLEVYPAGVEGVKLLCHAEAFTASCLSYEGVVALPLDAKVLEVSLPGSERSHDVLTGSEAAGTGEGLPLHGAGGAHALASWTSQVFDAGDVFVVEVFHILTNVRGSQVSTSIFVE
jgi:hypothetical protein